MSEKFKRLSKSLPSLYRPEVNTMIGGLLKAWGLSDDEVAVQIKEAKNQIFVSKSSEQFLDYLGNNVGVSRSPELGLEDEDFRALIPVLSYHPKQVRQTVIALLDVFWGPGFTRANVTSGNTGPYNFGSPTALTGAMTFTPESNRVLGVGTQFLSEIAPGEYIKATTASGYQFAKVSAVLDDNTLILSEKPENYETHVSVSGVKAPVMELEYEVDNGKDQRVIRFKPNAFNDLTAVTTQEIADFINNSHEHSQNITASAYIDPLAGNKLNLRSNTPGLQSAIHVLGGSANAPSILNFSQIKTTETKCAVYEVNPNEVVIKIPSSVPVLRRKLQGSMHPKETKTIIYSEVETYDFSSLGATSTLEVTVDGNDYTVNFDHATDFTNPEAATNEEVVTVINSQLSYLEAFALGDLSYKRVALRTTAGAAEYQVTGGTANSILNFTTEVQIDPDIIVEEYPAAYLFDPNGQLFTVTGIKSSLVGGIDSGTIQSSLLLSDSSIFPNKVGSFILNFGRSTQEGPIQYNSRPNNSTLLIDASYVFQNAHVEGEAVNFVSLTPTLPRITGDDYPVYVTGTAEARVAAQDLVKSLLAAGVVIRFVVEFPEVLFECCCEAPSDSVDLSGSRTGSPPLEF